MRLLLDTHVFLWFALADPRLPVGWRDAIADPANTVYLSVVAVWEAAIKYRLGKFPLPTPPEALFPAERVRHRIESLLVDEETVRHLAGLPALHKDPFDRIMVAQALQHDLTLVTADAAVRAYPVRLLAP